MDAAADKIRQHKRKHQMAYLDPNKLLDYISKDVRHGFTATVLVDKCIKVTYSGMIDFEQQTFDFILMPVCSASIYIVDNLTLFNTVNLYYHKDAYAYFMLKLAQYNVKLAKASK